MYKGHVNERKKFEKEIVLIIFVLNEEFIMINRKTTFFSTFLK
jgi:hypothetical protein